MALKFLSFLGTGIYQDTVYELNGVTANKTPYIQKALVEILAKNNQKVDQVYIFLTGKAKERNWQNNKDESNRVLLSEDLESIKEKYGIEIIPVEIPLTNHVNNIWEMFETIIELIDENDEIVFDITHSFRFQPMLALLILHFAGVIKNIVVKGIYYGSFDPEKADQVCPIIDLTLFSDLQDWITNVYAFLQSGNTAALTSWIDEKDKMIRRKERRTTLDLKALRKLTESWRALTMSLQTNRGPLLQEKADKALTYLQEIQRLEVRPEFRPLNTLYKKIENQFVGIAKEDPVESGLAAIEWCEGHFLIQQSYTMAKELMSTAICIKYGLNHRDMSERKKADTAVSFALKINDGQSSLEKVEDETIRKITKHLVNYPDLLSAVKVIQDYRNDINHAGWRADPLSEDKFHLQYENWYALFKKNITLFWEED